MRGSSLLVVQIYCTAVLLFCSSLVCSSLALAGTVQLPKTGQSMCYDSSGANIMCSGTGQDGDWQAGVPWPNPRFTVGTGDQAACVTDNFTGLIWVRTPDNTQRSWQGAFDYAKTLNLCGFSDWRVPTIVELESLMNAEQSDSAAWLNTQGFSNVKSHAGCWSSTTWAFNSTAGYAFVAFMWNEGVSHFDKTVSFYVWPVRGGQ